MLLARHKGGITTKGITLTNDPSVPSEEQDKSPLASFPEQCLVGTDVYLYGRCTKGLKEQSQMC